MINSLELNWIRKFDKTLIVPEIVFTDVDTVGGRYYPVEDNEILIDDRFYPLNRGLIEVSTIFDFGDTPNFSESTIAHEWRHHWQFCNGWKYDGVGFNSNTANWQDSIIRYFSQSKCEYDALRFENKFVPSEYTEWIIHKVNQKLNNGVIRYV